MQLDPIQLFILSTLASAIVYVLDLLAKYLGFKPGRAILTSIVYVISFALAVAWSGVPVPMFPPLGGELVDIIPALLTWLGDLLQYASPLVAFATLIYNTLGKNVFDQVASVFGVKVFQS